MPELGEVAHAAGILRKYALGKTIKSIECAIDEIVFVKPLDPLIFRKSLLGHKISNVGRQGKYFWFGTNNNNTILLHFGMTGWIHVKDQNTHFIMMEAASDEKRKKHVAEQKKQLEKEGKFTENPAPEAKEWPPRFTKFRLTFDDDMEVAFTDPRRLARIRLFTDTNSEKLLQSEPLSLLGNDFSQTPLSEEKVLKIFSSRKPAIKSLLMNQALFSGIGNWMADEILYQARIHPATPSNQMTETEAKSVYNHLVDVCKVAVETDANVAAFPDTWLMAHRWGKRKKNEVQKTAQGHELQFITIGGRTSCFAPALQILKSAESEPVAQIKVSEDPVIKTELAAADPKIEDSEVKEEVKFEEPPRKRVRSTRRAR